MPTDKDCGVALSISLVAVLITESSGIYTQHSSVTTGRKRAMKRTHFANVVERWARPYPYVTTISIVFEQNANKRILKVGFEDCCSHDGALM